jgi:hypothetical protein
MSEVREMLERFEANRQLERQARGGEPTMCIMGHHTYESFCGCVRAYYDTNALVPLCLKSPFALGVRHLIYNGIHIWPSYANEDGMVFGGMERD